MNIELARVVATIAVGAFAGWIATRTARRTPHDNLKALVGIEDKLDERDDPTGVVKEAIRREIRSLDRLNRSREGSYPKWLWIQITSKGGQPVTGLIFVPIAIAVAIVYDIYLTESMPGGDQGLARIASGLGVVALVGALASSYLAFRLSRNITPEEQEAAGLRFAEGARQEHKP